MDKENVTVITDREKLYDKCENMEQLYDKYYLPLLDIHYKKTYDLKQQLNKKDEAIEKAIQFIQNNGEKQYNYHDNYRGKWYSPDELDTILELLEDKEVE